MTKVHVMLFEFVKAYQSGMLKEGVPLFNFVADIASNMLRSPQGRRFSESTRTVMGALLLMGGPRSCNLISNNFDAPS